MTYIIQPIDLPIDSSVKWQDFEADTLPEALQMFCDYYDAPLGMKYRVIERVRFKKSGRAYIRGEVGRGVVGVGYSETAEDKRFADFICVSKFLSVKPSSD